MAARVDVTFFIDPGCPFGYSAWPALSTLRWRYGDQLHWRTVTIGLAEDPAEYEAKEFTPGFLASTQLGFREHGMPFAPAAKARLWATAPACRAIVAVRLRWPDRELAALRALQFAQFCSPLLIDEPDALREALRLVPGIDPVRAVDAIDDPEVVAAYEADRAEARTADGGPGAAQGKTAGERYTAPSMIFTAGGTALEAAGFQPLAGYDVLLANLDPSLERRPAPEDPAQLLASFPDGLTTAEVAAVMEDDGAEAALISVQAAGEIERTGLGDGALWTTPTRSGRFRSPGRSSVNFVTSSR